MIKTDTRPDLIMGGKEHQAKINSILDEIDEKGLESVREFQIILSNKTKKSRFVDVAGFDSNKKLVEIHLVSRLNKTGMMLKHELNAIQDIEEETGLKVHFHSFNYLDNISK